MPAVCVSRSRIVIGRVAGLVTRPVSLFVATVVCANAGMWRLTGSPIASAPSSTSDRIATRSEEHTSELQSQSNIVCRLLLEKKKKHAKNLAHAHASDYTCSSY